MLAIKEFYDRMYGRHRSSLKSPLRTIARSKSAHTRSRAPEVAVSIKELLTTAEKEMGLTPMTNKTNKERIERLLKQEAAVVTIIVQQHSSG